LNGEQAVESIRKACYALIERIGNESDDGLLPVDRYNELLAEQVRLSFPGINGNTTGIPMLDAKLGHVIHWIIFDAGIDIRYTGTHENRRGYINYNNFDYERIGDGIKKYSFHIRNLATNI